jgi:hypothetical protein
MTIHNKLGVCVLVGLAWVVLYIGTSVKVKEIRNRPGLSQTVPGAEGGEVSLTHRPPLPPGNVPGTHFH